MDNTSLINELTYKITNEPRNARLLYERSFEYLHNDEYEKAAIDCSQALELDPENLDYKWMQNHLNVLAENAERIKNNPENDIRILLGAQYISLLTPDADGQYRSKLMYKIGELREEMKNAHNIDVPLIRLMDSDLITDSEVALYINNVIVWKYELKENNLDDCDNAIFNELTNIFRSRCLNT